MKDRSISVIIKRRTSEILSVNARILQESPISPISFLFFNVSLIKEYANSRLKIQVKGFVNDIHLIAYEINIESKGKTLEKAYQVCLK